jgi:hypothetical protein
MIHDLTDLHIEDAASALRRAGARGVDAYELKLRQNAPNPTQVINHLSETRVALMFLGSGAQVTMRDSPDLEIEWLGERFYAEVKQFKWKVQDKLDEAAMRGSPGEFVVVGDTSQSEGRCSYQQVSDVARKKKGQYVNGAINVLVIDSESSGCFDLAETLAGSAAREFDEEVRRAPGDLALRRLLGILVIASWGSAGWNSRNVGFEKTEHALPHMSWKLIEAFRSIGQE